MDMTPEQGAILAVLAGGVIFVGAIIHLAFPKFYDFLGAMLDAYCNKDKK